MHSDVFQDLIGYTSEYKSEYKYHDCSSSSSGKDGPAPTHGDGKPVLVVRNLPERKSISICAQLAPAFDYLESRVTGTCEHQYDCTMMYAVRAFDPNFAAAHVDVAFFGVSYSQNPVVPVPS